MKFHELAEQHVGFCGVDNLSFCLIRSDGARLAFAAVEDESDGYRSMMEEVRSVPLEGLIFFRTPVARVKIQDDEGLFAGYHLIDDDGHVWLRLGTDHADDYYPMFIFEYTPPKTVCVAHDDCRTEAEMARACVSSRSEAISLPPSRGGTGE